MNIDEMEKKLVEKEDAVTNARNEIGRARKAKVQVATTETDMDNTRALLNTLVNKRNEANAALKDALKRTEKHLKK